MKKLPSLRPLIIGIVLLLGIQFVQSCGSARRSEPIMGPLAMRTQQLENGRHVFMVHCQKCHPAGEAGLGMPLNNVPLPGAAIRFRVRSKAFLLGLGRMPSFKEHEISKNQMDDLIKYMKALRRHDGKEVAASK